MTLPLALFHLQLLLYYLALGGAIVGGLLGLLGWPRDARLERRFGRWMLVGITLAALLGGVAGGLQRLAYPEAQLPTRLDQTRMAIAGVAILLALPLFFRSLRIGRGRREPLSPGARRVGYLLLWTGLLAALTVGVVEALYLESPAPLSLAASGRFWPRLTHVLLAMPIVGAVWLITLGAAHHRADAVVAHEARKMGGVILLGGIFIQYGMGLWLLAADWDAIVTMFEGGISTAGMLFIVSIVVGLALGGSGIVALVWRHGGAGPATLCWALLLPVMIGMLAARHRVVLAMTAGRDAAAGATPDMTAVAAFMALGMVGALVIAHLLIDPGKGYSVETSDHGR